MISKLFSFSTLILIFLLFSIVSNGQIISSQVRNDLYEHFEQVEDSVEKRFAARNSISFRIPHYRALYIFQDSSYWRGYCLINGEGVVPQPDLIRVENGIEYTEKHYRTIVYEFDADSLYRFLLKIGVLNIKQLTDDSIESLYTKSKTKKKGVQYRLGVSSHENYATIKINNQQNKIVNYRMSLVENRELHFIPTMKVFYIFWQTMNDISNHNYR